MSSSSASAVRSDSAFVSSLLREREVAARARLIARRAIEVVQAAAAAVYVCDASERGTWHAKGVAGAVEVDVSVAPAEGSTLARLAVDQRALLFSEAELTRESYAHLHTRRTVLSLGYVPFLIDGHMVGTLEVVSFDTKLGKDDLAMLTSLGEFAAPAIDSALAYERERNAALQSVDRLTQLYDLEKTFHSTLEIDAVLAAISSKFREILSAQAVHIWLVRTEDELLLMSSNGYDPTVQPGAVQKSGEGIAAEVGDSGEGLLIESAEDLRLAKRNGDRKEGGVFTLVATPMMVRDEEVGVVEAINKMDGMPFTEEDLFLLASIAETAAGALHNASLLEAERKVEILEALVRVSSEITSTLNLDRVLQEVVNHPATVIPYERAAVALEQTGRVRLKAISGTTQDPAAPEFKKLHEMMEWASSLNRETHIRQHGEQIDSDREDTRLRVKAYFEETGMRAFYAFPLGDDQGRVGILWLESSDPDFLGEAHLEMMKVVASQTTVALRNASLYQEVPFIGLLEPIAKQKRRFLALDRGRRLAILASAAMAAITLFLVPIPMRVEGSAVVKPALTSYVQPQVEGVVRRVLVREGQRVNSNDVLAELEDWDYRDALAATEARYQSALSAEKRALAGNDPSEAGVQQMEALYWASEMDRARERLQRTRLLAPTSGVITTPRVENLVGRHLDAGQTLAEIADTSRTSVDVEIDAHEVPLLRPNKTASVKLESFPTRTFRGAVAVISPASYFVGEDHVYYARLDVPNPEGLMHSGMQGRAKILVGWRPLGYVFFRLPVLWVYAKVWSLLGW